MRLFQSIFAALDYTKMSKIIKCKYKKVNISKVFE